MPNSRPAAAAATAGVEKNMIFVFGVTSSFILGFLLARVCFKKFVKPLLASVLLSILVAVLIEVYIEFSQIVGVEDTERTHFAGVGLPVVVWWTAFSRRRDEIQKCSHKRCLFTEKRNFRHVPEAKAFLFYGSDLNIADLPVPRNGELWALFHEESLKNAPILMSERFLSLFNFTSTFDRDSNLPLTTLHLNNLDAIVDTKFFLPTAAKNKLLETIAPVVYVQSSCDTLIDRDAYIANLSHYIKIDSFGQCLNNARLPEKLSTRESLSSQEFLIFLSRYKFIVTIENAACRDYITEKIWRALIVGSVPLYFGSPSIMDWMPNNNSAIFIEDFRSPRDLASFIIELNNNDELYDKFLLHKTAARIENEILTSAMKNRSWNEYESLIEKFECDVCLALHDADLSLLQQQRRSSGHRLKCEPPVSMLTNRKNKSNLWNAIVAMERCRGDAIHQFMSHNLTFSIESIEEAALSQLADGQCS